MKRCLSILSALCVISTGLMVAGCSSGSRSEHYVSSQPEIEVTSSKINLDEVQKAFFEAKGDDFKSRMAAFEKRVNEIYEGKDVVSIDATRENNRLVVTGYIDNKKEQGYQAGDEKLFSIEQTGEIANNDMPYRVNDYDGRVHYVGHRSIFDSPFVQMLVLSHMMNSWGGRYYTPYDRMGPLSSHRTAWRTSPAYETQKTANQGFFSRFKTKSNGSGLTSKTGFGSSTFSSGSTERKRSWFGGSSSSSSTFGSSSSSSSSGFSWGGRRSSGFKMRGFGGRRR
ncbi:MAG TPA: hypothetical protein PKZ32_11755 [Candidatus Melainabacteria bacterium]|nr:hypothetical protein [Candidatus Melainabacteria bacterium]